MQEIPIKDALKKKYPEVVVLVTSIDKTGKPNVMPAGWFAFANSNPPCLSVSIGYKRYTHKLISDSKEFTICFPSEGQEKDVIYCGEVSGQEVNKFEKCNLKPLPGKLVKAPLIKDSVLCFECKVVGQFDAPDHTIFFGEVVAAHYTPGKKRIFNFGKTKDNFRIIKEIPDLPKEV